MATDGPDKGPPVAGTVTTTDEPEAKVRVSTVEPGPTLALRVDD